jgi:hypothetical protein
LLKEMNTLLVEEINIEGGEGDFNTEEEEA